MVSGLIQSEIAKGKEIQVIVSRGYSSCVVRHAEMSVNCAGASGTAVVRLNPEVRSSVGC
jgi:hypothetical protein